MKNTNNKGFTLVEIMIVVAIIGLLAAIAIPNFVNARKTAMKNTCVNNIRLLSGAADQWALETKQTDTATISFTAIQDYVKGKVEPKCPVGDKSYTYGNLNDQFPIQCAGDAATDHNKAYQGVNN